MKKLTLSVLFLFSCLGFGATHVKTSARSKASALGQIADRNLAGKEATSLIKSILEGQDYDGRVSIMNTTCLQGSRTTATTCKVIIGVDNINDDDHGWGEVYRLDYVIDNKGKVLEATLTLIAG